MGHGLDTLFRPGVDFSTYDPSSLNELASAMLELLADPRRRESAAQAGYDTVNADHRPRHRALSLVQWISGLDLETIVNVRMRARDCRTELTRPLYLHWAQNVADSRTRQCYLNAARQKRQVRDLS